MKKGILLLALVLVMTSLVGCFKEEKGSSASPTTNVEQASEQSNGTEPSSSSDVGLNDTFGFDGFDITFSDALEWSTLNNQFSDRNGADVFKIPFTLKNLRDESEAFNSFYATLFAPDGTKIESISAYFDDAMSLTDKLRPGATLTKFMYFEYKGDGEYVIELDNYEQKGEIIFTVNKP